MSIDWWAMSERAASLGHDSPGRYFPGRGVDSAFQTSGNHVQSAGNRESSSRHHSRIARGRARTRAVAGLVAAHYRWVAIAASTPAPVIIGYAVIAYARG
jgi:hypothetical protein